SSGVSAPRCRRDAARASGSRACGRRSGSPSSARRCGRSSSGSRLLPSRVLLRLSSRPPVERLEERGTSLVRLVPLLDELVEPAPVAGGYPVRNRRTAGLPLDALCLGLDCRPNTISTHTRHPYPVTNVTASRPHLRFGAFSALVALFTSGRAGPP